MNTGSSEGTWEKLSQVAVPGAEYDSPKRSPHSECLEGTRGDILNRIYGVLDNREKNRLIWLHGTAGVGKSAVAFTVAERMRRLKVEPTNIETRLAGTFFFSRKTCCTTEHFFPTLAYQLANKFRRVQDEVNTAIRQDPALLYPNKPLRSQMEALFLPPLRRLRLRLRDCPPLVFVVDALDECKPETIAALISLLGEALRDPELPVTHILLTSRWEEHIREAIQKEQQISGIAGEPSGEISLDDADVVDDISLFFHASFSELQRHGFSLPPKDQLAQLTKRAGKRFIVASTMIKFIANGHSDTRRRLRLMLEPTSNLLPGTVVYELYDCILSTCTNPELAYLHLSVVAALAYPLPISEISKILGPGQGKDFETTLMELRPFMDIPTDSGLPVKIYHSSVLDYVANPSNSRFSEGQDITRAHTLLADSCFNLMVEDIPGSPTLLDALSALKGQSEAMQLGDPRTLKHSLSFIVQPLEPMQVLIALLWLRSHQSLDLQSWLENLDGHAWLQTPAGRHWLQTQGGKDWLGTQGGKDWLGTQGGKDWSGTKEGEACLQTQLQTRGGRACMPTESEQEWLQTESRREWLQTESGRRWLQTETRRGWFQTPGGQECLQTLSGKEWLQTADGREWLQTPGGREWLQTPGGREWLQTPGGQEWLQTQGGREWLQTQGGREWLHTQGGREWLQTRVGQQWLQTPRMQEWLQTPGGREWLQTSGGQKWLPTQTGQEWLQTQSCRDWLQTPGGREWLQTQSGRDWLQTPYGKAWQTTPAASVWVTMEEFTSTLEAISEDVNIPALPTPPAFQLIQQFKSLPDFLMFPAFLALKHQGHHTSALPQDSFPIIRDMKTFAELGNETWERSQSASDALKYASENWAFHLSRAPNPWDDMLQHMFQTFWSSHRLTWLERQWCLKGLQSCLVILSDGQKLAKVPVLPNDFGGSPRDAYVQSFHPSSGQLSILCMITLIALLFLYY